MLVFLGAVWINDALMMALAHTVSDKTAAAYNRSDLFERRRRLIEIDFPVLGAGRSRRSRRRSSRRGGSSEINQILVDLFVNAFILRSRIRRMSKAIASQLQFAFRTIR